MKNQSDTSNRELRLSRILQAPIELVWEVWTDPEHIIKWWGPDGFTSIIHKMELKEGGEWLLTLFGPDGKSYPNKSIFKEIVKHKKIVFQHFNPNFLTTVEFISQEEKTVMSWHMLFETQELFEIVVKTFGADKGLQQNVAKLEIYLTEKLLKQ